MNKTELIADIAEKNSLSKATAGKVLDNLLETIQDTLTREEGKLSLPGFGTFSTGKRAARTGRNPQTGETIKIAAAVTVKFSAGAGLKEAVQKKNKAKTKK